MVANKSTGHPARAPKAARLNIRTTDEEKDLLERAAIARHTSTSRFVLDAALRSAEEVLATQTLFVLPPQRWEEFIEMLDRPARPIPALERAAARQRRTDGG